VPFKEDDDRVLGSTRLDRWCSRLQGRRRAFLFCLPKIGLPVVIVRYFNIRAASGKIDVGRVSRSSWASSCVMSRLIRDRRRKQTRCFTYVDDAIRARWRQVWSRKP